MPTEDRFAAPSALNVERMRLPAIRELDFTPLHDPVLYGDSPAELNKASSWLSQAGDHFVIRLTGGCLKLSPGESERIQAVLLEALSPFKEGILISGATRSSLLGQPAIVRPCMPEIGVMLQAQRQSGCFFGVFPAAQMERNQENALRLALDQHDGSLWEITVDRQMERGLATARRTACFWDAEWQATLALLESFRSQTDRFRGQLLISYDGGVATENECRKWADLSLLDDKTQLVLIQGHASERATNRLIANESWRVAHPNVHCVQAEPAALRSLLAKLDVFTPQSSAIRSFPA